MVLIRLSIGNDGRHNDNSNDHSNGDAEALIMVINMMSMLVVIMTIKMTIATETTMAEMTTTILGMIRGLWASLIYPSVFLL